MKNSLNTQLNTSGNMPPTPANQKYHNTAIRRGKMVKAYKNPRINIYVIGLSTNKTQFTLECKSKDGTGTIKMLAISTLYV